MLSTSPKSQSTTTVDKEMLVKIALGGCPAHVNFCPPTVLRFVLVSPFLSFPCPGYVFALVLSQTILDSPFSLNVFSVRTCQFLLDQKALRKTYT